MRRSFWLILTLAAALPVAAAAQGMGQGMGRGPGMGRGGGPGLGACAQSQDYNGCLRVQNPDKHAKCWKEATGQGLWGPARRDFMMGCMAK